jgi:hypothetical protein
VIYTIDCYHFTGGGEYIVSVQLTIKLASEVEEKGTPGNIYEFSKDSVAIIPNLCPQFVPAGIAYNFGFVNGLYVKVGDLTRSLESVYTSFECIDRFSRFLRKYFVAIIFIMLSNRFKI